MKRRHDPNKKQVFHGICTNVHPCMFLFLCTEEHECQQKLWHFSPQNLVNVAWAFAKAALRVCCDAVRATKNEWNLYKLSNAQGHPGTGNCPFPWQEFSAPSQHFHGVGRAGLLLWAT